MKRFTAIAAALVLAFALCTGAFAAEKPQKFVPTEPIMPLSQIKPGMTGYAKTVFSGTKITPFEISVIGVLPRKTSPKNLIVIEVKDEYVRAHGGIAAGMLSLYPNREYPLPVCTGRNWFLSFFCTIFDIQNR